MKYMVHRVEVDEDSVQEKLELFLNRLDGEVMAVIPITKPKFLAMGATSVVKYVLIVEKK